jgi:hypothetical protein
LKKEQKGTIALKILGFLMVIWGVISFVGAYLIEGQGAYLINNKIMSSATFYGLCFFFDPLGQGPLNAIWIAFIVVGIVVFMFARRMSNYILK